MREEILKIQDKRYQFVAMFVEIKVHRNGKCFLSEMEERFPRQKNMMFSYLQWLKADKLFSASGCGNDICLTSKY